MSKKFIIISVLLILIISSLQITIGHDVDNEKITQKSSNIIYLDYDISTLPESFSWTDIDGVDFVTPVRGQSPFHSCETFAFTAAVEVMVQKEVGYPFGCDLSEAHLHQDYLIVVLH